MLRNRLMLVLGLLIIASMVLAACQPGEVTTEEPTEVATEEPVSTRTGAWVDQLVFVSQDSAEAAVSQLEAGEIDIYAYTVSDANVYATVQASENLDWVNSYGSPNEITYNPSGPEFTDGRLNPFAVAEIREATNWLLDRDYIAQEIYGGLAAPKFTVLGTAYPDYGRYAAVIGQIEAYYAFDVDKADAAIEEQMTLLGAAKNADGKYEYNGELVTIIGIIRTEDARQQIGDYVGTQLETIGFTVDRQFKTRTEASPIWSQSDPAEGQWHYYTGGWIYGGIDTDQGDEFASYYMSEGWPGNPLWDAYVVTDEYHDLGMRLLENDFATLEERDELFEAILPLSMQSSNRVWLMDQLSFTPFRKGLSVAYDLAGAVANSSLYPYTIRWEDQEGGIIKISQPGILVEPWNPIAGSNWVYDAMPQRATQDFGVLFDPYTGLTWPQRIERAEIVVEEGLPVIAHLDWVTLTTAPVGSITVPADAWADWDAANQVFIPAGEGITARSKVTAYYPADLWNITWHDGSALSIGDFVMGIIMTFEQAKPESLIYDATYAPALDSFLSHFKGVKIVSTDPLVIETYDDFISLDAEIMVTSWWPAYAQGPGAWHNLTPAILAEGAGLIAFSTAKAGELEVEWTNFIAGPTLEIQKTYLDQALAENYIPYAPTMGTYVTAEEATARWANLSAFYTTYGHFWIGTGPFYLASVSPVADTLTLNRWEAYPDLAVKWTRFGAPMIAEAEIEGPGQVTIGQEVTFDINISFEGEPYALDDLISVTWLVWDANGVLAAQGDAVAVEDGLYQITLGEDVTSTLVAGANALDIAIASRTVAVPTFARYEFVTVP